MERALEILTQHWSEYVEQAVDRVIAAKIPYYARFSRDELLAMIERVFSAVRQDIFEGTVQSYPDLLGKLGAARAKQGVWIGDMIHGPIRGFEVISEHFQRVFADDLAAQLWWAERRREISFAGVAALNEAFFHARDAIIVEQNAQLQRLSAPIIPVARGILVLPLVGAVDEERAASVIDALLSRISRDRAEVVIIDITGVAAVDRGVIAVLLQATQAARLLGARVILVGIRPEVAQTIVRMGISLPDLTTLADLESGVTRALRLQGKAITEAGKPSD